VLRTGHAGTDIGAPAPAGDPAAAAVWLDGDHVRIALGALPQAARQARQVAALALRVWRIEPLTDALVLVVSELVANAVTHARSPLVLDLETERVRPDGRVTTVRVSVTDASQDAPEHQNAGPGEEHGRGVHLVHLLSSRWGTRPLPTGKCVWAELDVDAGWR
jgi:anti-sigma regulatory factor (Ser/Thr protein kinase)